MWNGYQPYRRREIRFFPHIFPIAFPLIFPFGIGLVFWLSHALFSILGLLIAVAVVFFIVRTIMLGSPQAAWDSMKGTGNQWQQKFTAQRQQQTPYYQPQQPYYQPSTPAEQPSQEYDQGYQAGQQPYYQPTPQTGQQTPYYQPTPQPGQQQPYYRPTQQGNDKEQMPPMEQ